MFYLMASLDACPTSSERFMHRLAVVVFSQCHVFIKFSLLKSHNIHLLQISPSQPFLKFLLFLFRLNPSHIQACNLQHLNRLFDNLCSPFPSHRPELLSLALSQL